MREMDVLVVFASVVHIVCLADSIEEPTAGCNLPVTANFEFANLTCYYSVDITQYKKDVQVIQYTTNGGEPNIILTCLWDGEKEDCILNANYISYEIINTRINIRMFTNKVDFKNKYACTFLPIDLGTHSKCSGYEAGAPKFMKYPKDHSVTMGENNQVRLSFTDHPIDINTCSLHSISNSLNLEHPCATEMNDLKTISGCVCNLVGTPPNMYVIVYINDSLRPEGRWRLNVSNGFGSDEAEFVISKYKATQQTITLHSTPVMSPGVTNRLQKDETTEDTSNTKGEEKTVILVMGIMTGFAFIIAMSIAVIVVKLKRRIGSLEGESSRPQSLHVEKRETLLSLPVEVDNRPPEKKTELVPVPKIAQITQLEALPDSTGSDSKVNFTCQGADVMQVVFILKGQTSNPEITQTTAPALPQGHNYLTPCPPGYSTLDSTTNTQNIDNQQVIIEQPPERDNSSTQRHTQYYMLPSYMEESTDNNGEDTVSTAINSGKTKNFPTSDVESLKTLDNKPCNMYERHSKVSIGAESYYTTID